MQEETIKSFMKIGVNSIEDGESIFILTITYLDEIKNQAFNSDAASMIEGLINKIVIISENLNFNQDFINILEVDLTNFVNSVNSSTKNNVQVYFSKLYSNVMKFHNLLTKKTSKTEISVGPFQPDKSDKPRISFLIAEVIEQIQNSPYLTEKVKENLIEKLSQVIKELNSEKTNWGVYFKQMANAIMIISALSAIPSGIESVKNLLSAKEKLETANETVARSSLNISTHDLKEVFVINQTPQLEGKIIIELEQKTNHLENEKLLNK
ncbi:hypothetical protein ACFSJW_06165 [Flavobacterium artemisiae]|uniref:Toxic anion resistance protein (TelA) n=1 Tax=Flavobacterium artemisiae TaxID=2126556 RepID=A0ABW4HCF6_9FLAO